MRKLLLASAFTLLLGCGTEADIARANLSVEAGQFNLTRRIIFYNGITDSYILTIEGNCQIEYAFKLEVTCRVGHNQYKKHYLGLSDNVTFFSEQLEPKSVSTYHYKVLFKPQTIVPDIDLKTGLQDF